MQSPMVAPHSKTTLSPDSSALRKSDDGALGDSKVKTSSPHKAAVFCFFLTTVRCLHLRNVVAGPDTANS